MADEGAIAVCREFARRALDQGIPIDGVVLYGSMARDEPREWSDIDVLVLVRDEVPREQLRDGRRLLFRIATALDTRIEMIVTYTSRFETDEGTPIIEVARTEGIRIAA